VEQIESYRKLILLADGPEWRAVAAGGCRNTLSASVAFLGLKETC